MTSRVQDSVQSTIRRPVKAAKLQDVDYVKQKIRAGCCSQDCVHKFSVTEIMLHRAVAVPLSEAEVAERLIAHLHFCNSHSLPPRTFNGVKVCSPAFLLFWGLSNRKWRRCVAASEIGAVRLGRSSPTAQGVVETFTRAWLANYFEEETQPMADATPLRMLPHYTSSTSILSLLQEAFAAHFPDRPPDTPSSATMHKIWRAHFPSVKLAAVSEYGQCSLCVFLAQRASVVLAQDERQVLEREKKQHREDHRAQRDFSMSMKLFSEQNPSQSCYMMLDMTMPLILPSFGTAKPSVSGSLRVERELTGCFM